MPVPHEVGRERPTRMQRAALKRIARSAGKRAGEPLGEEDWGAYFTFFAQPRTRAAKAVLRSLPSSPRCGFCGAPFAGFGAALVRPLGYRPSAKNPNICASCVESSPPGGATRDLGVVFADIRGFTSLSERGGSGAAHAALRRFYRLAEDVFFPEALIDKVIGDAVLALYVPTLLGASSGRTREATPSEVAELMVRHAHALLECASSEPDMAVGVGIAFGEAFIGHVGSGRVHDFTAVGDVVNTASRLQSAALPGEAVIAADVAALLADPPGTEEQLVVKGKEHPVPVRRVRCG
jgi:adenylate cyclase